MNETPPVQKSPEPKAEVTDTPSGVFRLITHETKQAKVFTMATAIIAVLLSLGTVLGGYRLLLNDAKAQTREQVDAGLEMDRKRLSLLEETVKQHLAEANAKTIRDDDDRYRVQIEIRELQKVVLTKQASPILNEPPRPPASSDAGR